MANKIALFLMGEKGLKSLKSIVDKPSSRSAIHIVVGSRDKRVVRDYYDEIKDVATKASLAFVDRKEFDVQSNGVNFGIAISWRWLIKDSTFKLVVLHDSLLPRYRGFNPLVTALINGDTSIGVTAVLANRDFDSGYIVAQKNATISYPIKIQSAIEVVSELYKDVVLDVIAMADKGVVSGIAQDDRLASYSLWRNEEDYRIDWSRPAAEIRRHVDAVGFPYMGAFTDHAGVRVRVLEVEEAADLNIINRAPGKILRIDNGKPVVVCGQGLIRITQAETYDGREPFIFSKLRTLLD